MKETFLKICGFVKKNLKWIAVAAVFALVAINMGMCSKIKSEKDENARLHNNILAMGDSLKNYKDGVYNAAEMRALQLRVGELADSLKLERGKKPITIVKYVASVRDSFIVSTVTVRDTEYIDNMKFADAGVILSSENSVFGKSSRRVSIETPYYVNCDDGKLYADGESSVILEQNIWLDNTVYTDKAGYTYLRLKTDYPGMTFNSGTAIIVSDPKADRKKRKSFGLGIGIQAGYGVAFAGKPVMSPYIGVGIGLQWNPKFLQF